MIKKKFLKKKVNSNTIMFKSINVKNSNVQTFIIFYIDDTTSFASTFISKFLFEFESFLKIENNTSTRTQAKKENSKKEKKENFEETIER